jgi:hypothetical protein
MTPLNTVPRLKSVEKYGTSILLLNVILADLYPTKFGPFPTGGTMIQSSVFTFQADL